MPRARRAHVHGDQRPGRPRRPLAVRAALVLALAIAVPALAEAPAVTGTRLVTLKNGARVLLVPDPRAAALSVGVWFETGARYERPGIVGLSHLVEHLSARGVDPAGDPGVRRRIEALGGSTTSSATDDFTCFVHTVPPAALETVLKLEAGRFAAAPSQAMLDQDRARLREQNRARARTNLLERPVQVLYATAFTSHPYRLPITGDDGDLGRITLKDCQDFLRARYTPDHALITLVGPFDPDQALQLVRRHLESIGKGGDSRAAAAPREPEPTAERRGSAAGEAPVPILVVGWRAPAGANDDGAALDLVSALLTGGSASRLTRRLVADEQTSLFARSACDRQRDATMFWAAVVVKQDADSAAVEKSVVAEVERLASEPVPGEELDRARKQLEVALLSGRQTATDRGLLMGAAQMIVGDWRDADRQFERLRTLTPTDLQQAAARTFVPARRTVVWMKAAPSGAEGTGAGR